jgi:arylsulfatase A-like enzyme
MIETVSESEVEAFHDFYAAATRYVDDQARRLIRGLSERGVLADSIVVYTADHGEELFDRGTQGHRTKMYDELIRVPLIVEDRSETYQFDSCDQLLTSHLDLAPTIATLFDVEPPDRWRGQSLVETLQAGSVSIDRSHVFSELCHKSGLGGAVSLDSLVASVRSLDWKYIQNRQQGTEELYNLSDDPEESMDVSEENPDILREYQEILERRLKSVSEQSRSVDISENVQEQLEELGYLEDSSS